MTNACAYADILVSMTAMVHSGADVPTWVPDCAHQRVAALTQQVPAVAAAAQFQDTAMWSGWMAEAAPDRLPAVASSLTNFQQALLLQVSTTYGNCVCCHSILCCMWQKLWRA